MQSRSREQLQVSLNPNNCLKVGIVEAAPRKHLARRLQMIYNCNLWRLLWLQNPQT